MYRLKLLCYDYSNSGNTFHVVGNYTFDSFVELVKALRKKPAYTVSDESLIMCGDRHILSLNRWQ